MRILLLFLLTISLHAGDVAPTSLFDQVLKLQHVQEPEIDDQAMVTAFAEVVQSSRVALANATNTEGKITALSTSLLQARKVSYLSNQYWRDSTLAASLLRKQGNCLATSTLFVLVGDALGLPIKLVVIPHHAFVRWDDGKLRRNIETTAKGETISDEDYLYRLNSCDPADVIGLGWGKSLDHNGFMAELIECAAFHRAGEERLKDAVAFLDEVERLVPGRSDLALAHIHLRADLTKDRAAARVALGTLLEHGNPPPSVATGALMMLADDAGARGNVTGQRQLLLTAFAYAPKSAMHGVLHALAFCHRTMRDPRAARRYLELAITLVPNGSPELAGDLYNLAILQKNDHDLTTAIATIRRARQLNPESWNLQMLEAGYLMLDGQREAAQPIRAAIVKPRAEEEFWASMEAWYLAVSGDRDGFLKKLSVALETSNSLDTLQWIDQDEDLDPYRKDAEFIALIKHHRQRLGAASASVPIALPSP
jgi:tetratricopeptide (TPR) repeat protein